MINYSIYNGDMDNIKALYKFHSENLYNIEKQGRSREEYIEKYVFGIK